MDAKQELNADYISYRTWVPITIEPLRLAADR